MSGKMLKSGDTSVAAAAASAAERPKVTSATCWTSTPTTAHASRFCDMARIARPARVRVTKRCSAQKITRLPPSTSSRCQAQPSHVEDRGRQPGRHLLRLGAEHDDREVGEHDRRREGGDELYVPRPR